MKPHIKKTFRKRIYEIIDIAVQGDKASKAFDVFIFGLIISNVLMIVAESVESLYKLSPGFYTVFETVSVVIFSIEYLLRIWTAVENPEFSHFFKGRVRCALTPLLVIDLLAILPFYLPFIVFDLRILRIVRLFRVFRVLKLGRYSSSIQMMVRVLKAKKTDLICVFCILIFLMFLASTMMYYVENKVQPEIFSSIPASMWFSIATLTTVGWGDVCPITGIGRLMAALVAVLGIGVFALPTAILGAGFMQELSSSDCEIKKCPHCGEDLRKNI